MLQWKIKALSLINLMFSIYQSNPNLRSTNSNIPMKILIFFAGDFKYHSNNLFLKYNDKWSLKKYKFEILIYYNHLYINIFPKNSNLQRFKTITFKKQHLTKYIISAIWRTWHITWSFSYYLRRCIYYAKNILVEQQVSYYSRGPHEYTMS